MARNTIASNRSLRAGAACALMVSLLGVPGFGLTRKDAPARPAELDVRGIVGVPKGIGLVPPTPAQLKAIGSLQAAAGGPLTIRYNGLTATPRHLFSYSAYLSQPSADDADLIARNFLGRWASLWRFSADDLGALRLVSRATIDDINTTVLKYEQTAAGVPVYHGEVVVAVNGAGQVISVGGDSFPRLSVANAAVLTAAQAVGAAASALGLSGYSPASLGATQVLATHGELPAAYDPAERFAAGGPVTDEVVARRTVFPLGAVGRLAYVVTLTSGGIMWENVVDAETGQVLRRVSLTAFGESGGGVGAGRRGTFRPDVQDWVESLNAAGTATGKVFDTTPTAFSGYGGFGRPVAPGAPGYAADSVTDPAAGGGFRFGQVSRRNESPLVYGPAYGQVTRGLPDALNPSSGSRFGWFYLPTEMGGAEVREGDYNRGATRAFGYTIDPGAAGRNLPANSPTGDRTQPYAATLTGLGSTQLLADGRSLSAVLQSSYTEGNNVFVCDDRVNDDEATPGIKGFSATRRFVADYFTYNHSYEFGGVDAADGSFPASADPDVFPGTVSLFYFNNVMHDYLYGIGFTEKLWNFQQDNFGLGGRGNDAVSAQVQDGSGTDNANFSTPSDGSRPRMQMYLFTDGSFRRADGDFDFDVVAHEFFHGVSNRSVAKGGSGCLGLTLVGEAGGQGEGWSDYIASSMTDDDSEGEYATGQFDIGIRRLPYTNYRWSYGALNGSARTRRDGGAPDLYAGSVPFEVHDVGEVWAAVLWDMRELMIVKDPNGVFFDGGRRLGGGAPFFIGGRQVQSVDAKHPIEYREAFSTEDPATLDPAQSIVRPGLIADEIARLGHRNGPLATAVRNGARLSDTLMLRGLQLSPCNPSFVESRDSILLADRELTGGENQAIIWRAFASHGVGANAASTAGTADDAPSTMVPVIVEDFTVPAGVSQAETLGPPAAPAFALSNVTANTVTVTINGGAPVAGAQSYVIARAASADGPFVNVATVPASQTVFQDNDGGEGLTVRQPFYYRVRVVRSPEWVSGSATQSITLRVGQVITPAPSFAGAYSVTDTGECTKLTVTWRPGTARNKGSETIYDVYRVTSVAPGDGTTEPTFVPSAANRVATGLRKVTSFTDTGLAAGQVYYYIVQARDSKTGKVDTKGLGNRVVRFNAPGSSANGAPVFAAEGFESGSADTRFLPVLVAGSAPNQGLAAFQRVAGVALGNGTSSSVMYAPDFDPGSDGAPSDFAAVVGPLALTPTSMLEFDHFFETEAGFDGGVVELALGSPVFNAAQYPDNTTTFDLGNYMVAGGYNAQLDGSSLGLTSVLYKRRAFTGARAFGHTKIAVGSFAPGARNNPLGLPVFVRLRMTSDAGTSAGPNSGWYVDNFAVNTLNPQACSGY